MTHPIDNAATWRDLADELTPTQVAKLDVLEHRSQLPADETAEALLEGARDWAQGNLRAHIMFDHFGTPTGAVTVYLPWEVDDGVWERHFEGALHRIGNATVQIVGSQAQDGRTKRGIMVDARDELNAVNARRLAAALVEAADELERLK